jgi:type VI protein secretion system component VasK
MPPALSLDRLPGGPWRPLEVLLVLVTLMAAPPLALAYGAWKLWRAARRARSEQPAPVAASPFEAHRQATLDRLAAEEREYQETLQELRRRRDPAEFERFSGGRRGSV